METYSNAMSLLVQGRLNECDDMLRLKHQGKILDPDNKIEERRERLRRRHDEIEEALKLIEP
jgi:hypothetical protein